MANVQVHGITAVIDLFCSRHDDNAGLCICESPLILVLQAYPYTRMRACVCRYIHNLVCSYENTFITISTPVILKSWTTGVTITLPLLLVGYEVVCLVLSAICETIIRVAIRILGIVIDPDNAPASAKQLSRPHCDAARTETQNSSSSSSHH